MKCCTRVDHADIMGAIFPLFDTRVCFLDSTRRCLTCVFSPICFDKGNYRAHAEARPTPRWVTARNPDSVRAESG